MRSIKTTSGTEVALDGDLLAVLEALFHEVTAKRELERSFEDLNREINHLIDQLTDEVRVSPSTRFAYGSAQPQTMRPSHSRTPIDQGHEQVNRVAR